MLPTLPSSTLGLHLVTPHGIVHLHLHRSRTLHFFTLLLLFIMSLLNVFLSPLIWSNVYKPFTNFHSLLRALSNLPIPLREGHLLHLLPHGIPCLEPLYARLPSAILLQLHMPTCSFPSLPTSLFILSRFGCSILSLTLRSRLWGMVMLEYIDCAVPLSLSNAGMAGVNEVVAQTDATCLYLCPSSGSCSFPSIFPK